MDGTIPSISSAELYGRLGVAGAPRVLDVRGSANFGGDGILIVGALRCLPEDAGKVVAGIPEAGRPIVVYCTDGQDISRSVTERLRRGGADAVFLDGGIAGWRSQGLPTRKWFGSLDAKWVTRERPKIDRIACPWLISRFINPRAEFLYVSAEQVIAVARQTGATAYDIRGAHFGHVEDRCSFDAIIRSFEIKDGALNLLATIVRGADTARPDLTPQCDGLLAISSGLSMNHPDDHEMLKHGMVIYDALYSWCRSRQ